MYIESTSYSAQAAEVIFSSFTPSDLFHGSCFVFCILHLKYFREDPKLDWATLIQTDRQQVGKNLITRQYDSPLQIPIVLIHRWERLGLSIWFNTYDNHCDRTAEKHCWGVQRPGEKSQWRAHGRAYEKGLAILCVCGDEKAVSEQWWHSRTRNGAHTASLYFFASQVKQISIQQSQLVPLGWKSW